MNLDSIVQDIIAGVSAGLILAGSAWLINWVRNLRLENELRRTLIEPNGIGYGQNPSTLQGVFSLQIHNKSNAYIRIRSITFVGKPAQVELMPKHGMSIYQTPLINEIIQPTFKRKYLLKGMIESDGNPNVMVLPPKTMGEWEVPPETIGFHEWTVDNIYVLIEYPTIFGGSALIRMEAPQSTLELVQHGFERLARAVHNKKHFELLTPIEKLRFSKANR